MKITRKLNSLVVLALLVVNATVCIYLVQRMTRDVRQLAEVEQPLEEAILEMEINAGETAWAVFDLGQLPHVPRHLLAHLGRARKYEHV